ncbi:hypothetical protein BJY01DRAFT_44639 [Aspergillus pseudoustus]|uniref:RNA polymerase Rpb1 C-terminal repeat domain-containing protein n=1 Tax=Aspergillus pseudoustus TaxID=1810923 RepID=A0ABR4KPU7_9EURO
MGKSGKKSKNKADNGKKNKKGKSQETSESPTPQAELSSTEPEEQQLAAATPLPDEVADSTPVPTPEPELQPAPEHTSVPEVAPEPVQETQEPAPTVETAAEQADQPAEPEQPSEVVQQQQQFIQPISTLFDFGSPSQSPADDDGFTQIDKPGTPTPSDQHLGMRGTQSEVVYEPSQEDLGAWEQLDTAEVKNGDDDAATIQQSGSVGASERIPVTAPQSPTFSFAPETGTEPTDAWPAWEDNEQPKASVSEENTTTLQEAEGGITFASDNPFAVPAPEPVSEPIEPVVEPILEPAAEPEQPKSVPEAALAVAPGSHEEVVAPAMEPELEPVVEAQPLADPEQAVEPEPLTISIPVQEPEQVAEPDPITPTQETIAMDPERTVEPAQEVTPPASKPQSPAPETASPSYKSASPMQRAISPSISVAETIDEPHNISPIPPPAAPTPPVASPRNQHAAPTIKDTVFPAPRAAPPTPPNASPLYHPSYPMDQGYSPRQKPASPVQHHPTPIRKHSSPLPKVSSPLAHTYTSPVMSPHTTSLPPMPPSVPPSVSHSYATAYQSPVMSSGGYFPPHYGYYQPQPTSHPHPMQRGPMPPPPPNGANPFQGMREVIYASNEREHHPGSNKGGPTVPPDQEDAREMLQRIQEAIPDINRLLGTFKHTKTKLQSREAEFKQLESQHKQALMHKEFFIEALQNQLRKTANEGAEEASRLKNMINELRMELGNLEEKRKDLEEKLTESEGVIEKLEDGKADFEAQIKKLNENIEEERVAQSQALEKQRNEKDAEREEALTAQKHELTELFEEIKAEDEKAAADALAAREAELYEQQDAMKTEYEQQKQQMQESHNTLQAEFDSKLTELASTKEELEQKHQELEDTRKAHAEEIESLENSHQVKVAEIERVWNDKKTALETQLSERTVELATSERENKRLEEDVLAKEKQLGHSVDSMRVTIDNLDKDCDRLRKTLHSLGEATDLKNTKGDTFFLDCFDQLHRLIVALSKEHFSYLPIDPPQEVLSKLPLELPSFFDNTPASCELRALYVQHVVSKTLTYRIFHPFLFTLGRRYDKADILFQMLSMDIRRKSVRREAFWRQQTLKAAYTTSDAKESINVVAAVIVDEISNHLKHFADPRRMDSLLTGIRKIVKLAAETWRHARVERELILASLPAPEAGSLPGEAWEEYDSSKQERLSSTPKTDPARRVILRPFPRIIREAAHEDFVGDEKKAHPCTYSQGAVLYSDSPVVLARLQELAKKSTDALTGTEDLPRRYSRGSAYEVPPSPVPTESTYVAHDALIDGVSGDNFATA